MTQKQRVLNYMREHGSITRGEALNKIGVANLTACISDLRRSGYNIITHTIEAKNMYGQDIKYAKYTVREGVKDAD